MLTDTYAQRIFFALLVPDYVTCSYVLSSIEPVACPEVKTPPNMPIATGARARARTRRQPPHKSARLSITSHIAPHPSSRALRATRSGPDHWLCTIGHLPPACLTPRAVPWPRVGPGPRRAAPLPRVAAFEGGRLPPRSPRRPARARGCRPPRARAAPSSARLIVNNHCPFHFSLL